MDSIIDLVLVIVGTVVTVILFLVGAMFVASIFKAISELFKKE